MKPIPLINWLIVVNEKHEELPWAGFEPTSPWTPVGCDDHYTIRTTTLATQLSRQWIGLSWVSRDSFTGGMGKPKPLHSLKPKDRLTIHRQTPTNQHIYIYIYNWICQKVAAEIVKTSQFCWGQKLKEKLPSPPLCFGQTTANHLPTPQCGFTLIGDQKQIIIRLYTGAGKIVNEGML